MKRMALHGAMALALLTAGCGAGTDPALEGTAERGAEHAGAQPHGHELSATAGPGFTATDVRFMQMMIGHHAQALAMAEMAPDRAADPDVVNLAQKIDISQRDEIEFMKGWLLERDQPVPEEGRMLSMQMPGMVTAEQLAELEQARGAEFDRLFLSFMIDHHLGAVEMVDDLFADPLAAQDPDIFRFVTDVGTDQLDEIGVMDIMLDRIDPSPRSDSR